MIKDEESLQNARKNFMVIGDAMLDCYVYGEVNRISPEAPCPIVRYSHVKEQLGGAANVAMNLLTMNQNVYFFSMVGDDSKGKRIEELLNENHVTYTYLAKDVNRTTTVKTRIMSEGQHMLRIDDETTIDMSEYYEHDLVQQIEQKMADVDVVILSDYRKGLFTRSFTTKVIKIANNMGKKVLVDLKGGDITIFRGAYWVKPNKYELEAITKCETDSLDKIQNAMKQLKETLECQHVLVTRGSEGMILLNQENLFFDLKANAKQVYDVTGAGDTVISYIALGVACQLSDLKCITWANMAASIKVSKSGTTGVRVEEVQQAFKAKYASISKIRTIEELMQDLEERKHEKVIFTNGCFDLLHCGHIQCLKKAKELGDLLVVGVNSDASVSRLKGPTRPINHDEDRMKVLEALESVDYVVKFEEDTPYELIKRIKPNVIVKGSDYKAEEVVGYDIVTQYGGTVALIDLVEGKSTTNMIRLAKNN